MIAENTGRTLCRLLAAWIHHTPWRTEETLDFETLFQVAGRHLLSAAVCAALEQTGLMEDCPPETAKRFREAKTKSVRKTILMDAERGKLIAALEERNIWYAPLKGIVINTVYPQYGTRQFADNDILIDAERWSDVRDLMKGFGYSAKAGAAGKNVHDSYYKRPVYNFEMHQSLFLADGGSNCMSVCASYYENVRERLIKDEDNGCGYHFGDEDFYIYFLAHAYKHYSAGGTGLRTLLDVYLYRMARPEMNMAYIRGELQKLGLTEFETVCRSLTGKLFGPAPCPALTEEERDMLDWMESSGVYGTDFHRVRSGLRNFQGNGGAVTAWSKVRYLLWYIFPPWDWYQSHAPFVYRHRWAVPFFWGYRLCRGVFVNGKNNFRTAGAICSYREK